MDLSLMVAGGGGTTLAELGGLARAAEEAGLAGVYLAEAWRSGLVPTAALAAATTHIRVGPYVLNAHARSPLFTGIAAVDLDEMTGGRLVLGIGSGNEVTNARYQGIPVSRPLAKMRDYVEVLRLVTTARAGARVDFQGAVHSTTGWYSQVDPVRPSIPIVLAATSPRMTDLAADVADGLALGSLLSAPFAASVSRQAKQRSPRAGFRVMMAAFAAVSQDREEARTAARAAVVNLYAGKPHPHYDRLLRQQGHAAVADRIGELVSQGDVAEARRAIPEELLDTLVIAGSPGECQARLSEYHELDEVLMVNVNAMHYRTDPAAREPLPSSLPESYQSLLELAVGRPAQRELLHDN